MTDSAPEPARAAFEDPFEFAEARTPCTLPYERTEMDERVYWQLADRAADGASAAIAIREAPLPRRELLASRRQAHRGAARPLRPQGPTAVTVSWLGHLLVVIAVAIAGRHAGNGPISSSGPLRVSAWASTWALATLTCLASACSVALAYSTSPEKRAYH